MGYVPQTMIMKLYGSFRIEQASIWLHRTTGWSA